MIALIVLGASILGKRGGVPGHSGGGRPRS